MSATGNDDKMGSPRRRKRVTIDSDAINVDRIRAGEWRVVLGEVGSVEYNRLRMIAVNDRES